MNVIIYFLTLISLLTFKINAYEVDFMNNERDTYNRYDPDSTLYGFCPFWGVLLLILSAIFLAIAGVGLIGYLIGWRTPVQSHHPSTDSTTPFFVIQNFTKSI